MVDPKIRMISYLSLLVEVGMFDYIKMSYLPVGHTHEDIDQAFSRIAVYSIAMMPLTWTNLFIQFVSHL